MLCGGKCYKMIEKNRGNEVILEMVEALKNKNFEFPRAHYVSGGNEPWQNTEQFPMDI